ncbi:MAG: hypothetical protein MUE46_07670 [Xanthomonadales bacterium]|jgi:hypothetical protein|nr:hypothetical protein [Xanthomonadales bacterium]
MVRVMADCRGVGRVGSACCIVHWSEAPWRIDVHAQTLETCECDERGRWVLLQTFAGNEPG